MTLASTFPGDLQIGRPLDGHLRMLLPAGRFGTGRSSNTRKHEGVDLLANPGANVYPVLDGVVLETGRIGGSSANQRIVVQHHVGESAIITRYMHLQAVNVSAGQFVDVGATVLGEVGPTPTAGSTAHHLHFEIRHVLNHAIQASDHKRSSLPVDPTPFLLELDELHHGLHDTRGPAKISELAMMRTRALEFMRVHWLDGSYHLPLFGRSAYERELTELLRCAFLRQCEVRLASRTSSLLDGLRVITGARALV